jgi:hypothetical protein
MINEIIESLKPKITALPFIDKYGGLVRVVKKAYTNEQGVYYKTFPVTCETDLSDCGDEGKLKALTPNDSYKSLAYFESAGNVRVSSTQYKGKEVVKVTAPIDFICWLNLPKLGISECHSSIFELMMIQFFYEDHKGKCESSPITYTDLKINILSFSSRDEKIFSKYSYGDMLGLTLYPFDFFKVNLEITFYVDPNCLKGFVFGAPLLNC